LLKVFFLCTDMMRLREIADKLKDVDETDPWRAEMTHLLTAKFLGLVPTKRSLLLASKVNASAFCRRRLPVILMRSHMAETMKAAVTFVEQGHVRVGPDIIRDPAFLVPRAMEDYITWAPGSKIRQRVDTYNGIRDDFNDV
uniref:U3 small nucleolar ribonucleoprotein protein IMP3 n=1 Tax=Echinostoma caproni TaxID=27848 RepID=A0A183BDB0_9TREM